jgi:hypothetical protein
MVEHTIKLENGDEITFQFERVDFDNPDTIIHYGHEVKEQIVEVFKKVSDEASDYEELALTDDLIKNIESFNDVLEESDKKLEKQQKSLPFKAKKILSRLGVKGLDTSVKTNSYKKQYEEYLGKIEETKKIIESVKVGAIADAKTRQELAKSLTPFLAILACVIEIGKEDREKFVLSLKALSEEITKMETDPTLYDEQKLIDLKNDLQIKKQFLNLFDDRINTLEKDLIIYKENKQTYLLQQTNEFQILLAAEAYLKDVITVLTTQASIHIFNRKQERRISVVDRMIQAGNTALQKDAMLLQQNVQAVGKLSLKQGIYSSTTEAISTSLRETSRLYLEGRAIKEAQIESDRLFIEDISRRLDADMIDLASYGEIGIMDSVIGTKKISGGPQKKLTFKRK